jgi:hypothetical protein
MAGMPNTTTVPGTTPSGESPSLAAVNNENAQLSSELANPIPTLDSASPSPGSTISTLDASPSPSTSLTLDPPPPTYGTGGIPSDGGGGGGGVADGGGD